MQIRIRAYKFDVSEPYRAGSVLSEAEAKVLNSARTNYLRDKIERRVKSAERKAGGGVLGQEALAGLLDLAAQLDSDFTFSPREYETPLSALELQVELVAEERVEQLAREAGKALSSAEREAYVAEIRDHEYVQAEARRRVEAKRAVALEAL